MNDNLGMSEPAVYEPPALVDAGRYNEMTEGGGWIFEEASGFMA